MSAVVRQQLRTVCSGSVKWRGRELRSCRLTHGEGEVRKEWDESGWAEERAANGDWIGTGLNFLLAGMAAGCFQNFQLP